MQECGSFTFQLATKEEAEMVANTIKEWAEENLTFYGWTSQLFPVSENFLFVGNNAAMNYFEWDIKISKLPDVVLTKHPTLKFSGEQSFCNLTTGFSLREKFTCNGKSVKYKMCKS